MKNGVVIGIDVGSPTRRSSAICRREWSHTVVSREVAARFRAVNYEREQIIVHLASRYPILALRPVPGLGLDEAA